MCSLTAFFIKKMGVVIMLSVSGRKSDYAVKIRKGEIKIE